MKNKTKQYLKRFFNLNCRKNWDSFESFMAEVGTPHKPNVRLTRKCITKGYVSGNLMWAKAANRSSAYLVKTASGNVASMRAACEQDGVKYMKPMSFMSNYGMQANAQAVFLYSKMDKNAKKMFRRNALANAVKTLVTA